MGRSISLEVAQCLDTDMYRAFEILSLAFGHENPFNEAFYPLHDTPTGRADGAARLLAFNKEDPNTTFLKATDVSTGEIIGFAKWNVYDGVIPEEVRKCEGNYWASEDARELAEWNMNDFLRLRRKAIRDSGGRLVSLDLMCVDPAHQFRGAGTLLMLWGVEQADKLGVEAVVEGSVYGRRLYENFGFVVEEHVTMIPPKRWATEDSTKRQRFFWMRRPRTL